MENSTAVRFKCVHVSSNENTNVIFFNAFSQIFRVSNVKCVAVQFSVN